MQVAVRFRPLAEEDGPQGPFKSEPGVLTSTCEQISIKWLGLS